MTSARPPRERAPRERSARERTPHDKTPREKPARSDARKVPTVPDPLALALAETGPLDVFLRQWFRANPAMGRMDRAQLAELIFDVMRNRRLYDHLCEGDPTALRAYGRSACMRALSLRRRQLLDGQDTRGVEPALRQWAEQRMTLFGHLQVPVRLSMPAPWWDLLVPRLGEKDTARLAEHLLQAAPLDLRVNILKSTPEQVSAMLTKKGFTLQPIPEVPLGLRLEGKPALEKTIVFEQGWVEVQDAGSQRLVQFAQPKRGQTVVDFCAGAGGKTLAMAAMMRNSGQIFACDVSGPRLRRMAPRLSRSGATNVQPFQIDSEQDPKLKRMQARADLVLVDAPCSGSGTVRRNPEIKWRVGLEDLGRFAKIQSSILLAAARLVKPGGHLVYATCSLFEQENEMVAEAFEKQMAGSFEREEQLRLWPHIDDSDGFFAVRWKRTKAKSAPKATPAVIDEEPAAHDQ